ncbi:DUF6502 family protein [Actibacterium mucosum]|nr:DUF6502 family protein [Actibacterium mucosum]
MLDSLLAPFARLMVARGIPFPDLAERLKAHYVEAAQTLSEGKVTDSKLSVMTGLQRRDVARLRDFTPKPQRLNHLSRLVALWQTEAAYLSNGQPRILPKNGAAPSFEDLARFVRRDVHPRTMLDALEAAGTVRVHAETGAVELIEASFQPATGSDDQIAYLVANVGDHLDAATDNVTTNPAPHFERAVHYTGLSADDLAKLQSMHHTAQMKLFRDLSSRAAEMKKTTNPDHPHRFRAGAYFYHPKGDQE